MKFLTPGEAETKRHKAVDFLHRIGKDDLADEFEGMSAEEYAQHKGATLMNSGTRKGTMAKGKSKADLEDELDDANDYIEKLESRLNDIVGIASEDDDNDDADNDDDEEDDDSGNNSPAVRSAVSQGSQSDY